MPCLLQRILTFKDAITFQPLKIVDLEKKDMTRIYQYSWSTDGVCWTNWVTYDQYLYLAKNIEGDFYLRVLVTGSIDQVSLNGSLTNCYNICIAEHNWEFNFCDDPNLFQPYANLDCALLLQQQLADAVVCMLGIPVFYFRCEPDENTADYTFKEYVMHNVVACKQIKLMIPDGQMPSSNPKLNDLDFDWQIDWETEVSKTQFAAAFGDTAIPKARDFLYIPMMKRMWEVNAAYDEKQEGLLWRSTTWKLALMKYTESTNVDAEGFDAVIDNMLGKTWENTFQEKETNEQIRESGYAQLQAPKFAATNLYDIFMEDSTRQAYTRDDITILDKIYCHHGNITARNIYKFKNENGCITYQKGICGDNGTISMMIETQGHMEGDMSKTIAEFGPIEFEMGFDKKTNKFNFVVEDLSAELEPFSTYLVVYRWNRRTYTKELSIYQHVHRKDVPVYAIKPEMYWFDFETPVAELTSKYNDDYQICESQQCQLHGYPLLMTNIKLYNSYIDKDEIIRESCKYTTTHDDCVFNDLARPIFTGRGYNVR